MKAVCERNSGVVKKTVRCTHSGTIIKLEGIGKAFSVCVNNRRLTKRNKTNTATKNKIITAMKAAVALVVGTGSAMASTAHPHGHAVL